MPCSIGAAYRRRTPRFGYRGSIPQRPDWIDPRRAPGGQETRGQRGAQPATQPAKFYINLHPGENRQFDPNCATPFHDFHIHTNHYQVIELAGLKEETSAAVGTSNPTDKCEKRRFKYPIWQDSTTLPSACYAIDNEGTSVLEPGHVKIRLRFEDFTGEYVLHCHFLGHEDLGMMLAVQTICKETADHKEHFGAARPAGPECVPGNYVPAAPRCKPVLTSAPSSSDGQ
jgi:hypothetical protein